MNEFSIPEESEQMEINERLEVWRNLAAQKGKELNAVRAQLAAMTAERDALKAQLDAVPVKAIQVAFDTSEISGWGNDHWNALSDELRAWLKEVTT